MLVPSIVIFIAVYILAGLRIVPQNNEGLVETLGKYSRTVKAGLVFMWPLFQRVRKVPLALQPLEISKYSIITKDNAEITTSLTWTIWLLTLTSTFTTTLIQLNPWCN